MRCNTEEGRSTSLCSLYGQLSQGRMANFPAFIASKSFELCSAVFSGGAGGARAPPEFGASEKGRSLISAYRSLALTTNTPGFKKLYTALPGGDCWGQGGLSLYVVTRGG
jgi:hypothetical protein